MKKGDIIGSNSTKNGIQNGHSKALKHIFTGTAIYNLLCVVPGKNGKILRAEGSSGQIGTKTNKLAKVRLKSGHCRWFDIKTIATTGTVSNSDCHFIQFLKAGQSRWLRRRSYVCGVAMNSVDQPHGGGEGKTSGGRPSVTPWGKPTKGLKTRRSK